MVPTAEQFDLVVIGGGPAGYAAALYGATAGLNIALVERDALGGTCLNRGCIPAKAFLETAAVFRHVAHAGDFGVEASAPAINFATTQARKQKIVAGLVGGIGSLCKGRKVTVLNGTGSLGPDHTVTVQMNDGSTTVLQGEYIALCAGSVPRMIPGFERGGPIMSSDEVLDLDYVPSRIAVIGGGAIGCEFASAFADLGAQVTILEGLPKILPGLDADVADVVVRSFKKKKIDIRTGVMVRGHTPNGTGGTTVHFGEGEDLEVDAVIVSVGRRPYADLLGLDQTKVAVSDRGFVEVDEWCRTTEPGVYALGDLINTPQLAHVGYAEAFVMVRDILGEAPMPVNYDRVPWAIYCHPEVAWAGPGEDACKAAGIDVVVRSFKKKKIDIRTGVMVRGHTPNGSGGTTVHFGEGEDLDVDAVIVSVGRRPYADLLGLDQTKVAVSDRGFVEVDEWCRTTEPGVYALGDLINTPQLAHVGYAEAFVMVRDILGEAPMPVNYDRVPWAIYCHPEVAWAGPGEDACKAAGIDVVVSKHHFRVNSRAMIIGETDGLVKVIAKKNPDGSAGQILGVHMVGPWVTEQLSGGYLAVNWEATVQDTIDFVMPHPSLTELFGESVMALTGRSINA